jgi:hypothetical protein
VAGDSIAVVEVPHSLGVEADGFPVVHLHVELAVFVDLPDRAKVAIGNA